MSSSLLLILKRTAHSELSVLFQLPCTQCTQENKRSNYRVLSVLRRIKGPIEFRERNAQCQHSLKIFNNVLPIFLPKLNKLLFYFYIICGALLQVETLQFILFKLYRILFTYNLLIENKRLG